MYDIRPHNDVKKVSFYINWIKNQTTNSLNSYSFVDTASKTASYLDIISNPEEHRAFIVAWKIVIKDVENEQWKLKYRLKKFGRYDGKTVFDSTLTNLYNLRTIITNMMILEADNV